MLSQPDEIDIAEAIDWFEKVTCVEVCKVVGKWAGLRTFAPYRSPVIGFDGTEARFFWLVGQGGFGIQTCDAAGTIAASQILSRPSLRPDLQSIQSALLPTRFDR